MSVCESHPGSIGGTVNELWPCDTWRECSCVGVHAHVVLRAAYQFVLLTKFLYVIVLKNLCHGVGQFWPWLI